MNSHLCFKTMKRAAAGLLLAGGISSVALSEGNGNRPVGASYATRAPVIAQHGMAASAQPLATQIAIDILKKGGSAVDAAIAANAALGLMEPGSCGIGGDLFAIVWDPRTKQLYGYNGSGRSPMGRSLDDMKRKLADRTQIPVRGSLSVTVPGAVDGWFALHERFGRLPMSEILAPAIAYARDGFPMSQLIASELEDTMRRLATFSDIEELDNARRIYFVGGRTPAEGEIFRNSDLARTYETIAREGRDAYYKGSIARTMDAYFRRIGGDLRYADFAAHSGEWMNPVSVNYRGYDVYEMPPNGQGTAALQMLNILEGFDLKAMGPGSADALHVMIEAKRLAFEDLAKFYGDPAFVNVPIRQLLSDAYAAQRRALIRMDRANPSVGPGELKLVAGDTTYLTVADKDGMMISIIQSLYSGLGAGLAPDGLGFAFQNRGALFSLDPASPNVYAPQKRPFHTIIPAFVLKDGAPWLSFGVMGGSMQPQGHVQILVNMIDFGMNVQEAGDFMRFNHSGGTTPTGLPAEGVGRVLVESGLSPATRAELTNRGHALETAAGAFGGYQAILWDATNRAYRGASEMRKDGQASGY